MTNPIHQKFLEQLNQAKERIRKREILDDLLQEPTAEEGDMRDNLGRLEVYHNGQWIPHE